MSLTGHKRKAGHAVVDTRIHKRTKSSLEETKATFMESLKQYLKEMDSDPIHYRLTMLALQTKIEEGLKSDDAAFKIALFVQFCNGCFKQALQPKFIKEKPDLINDVSCPFQLFTEDDYKENDGRITSSMIANIDEEALNKIAGSLGISGINDLMPYQIVNTLTHLGGMKLSVVDDQVMTNATGENKPFEI